MAQFMGYPVTQPRFVLITVVVDEHSPAWQVGEHETAVPCGNMQMKDSRIIQVFPMGDKKDSQRKNFGMHQPNLCPQRRLLGGRGIKDRVAAIRSTFPSRRYFRRCV